MILEGISKWYKSIIAKTIKHEKTIEDKIAFIGKREVYRILKRTPTKISIIIYCIEIDVLQLEHFPLNRI